MTARRRARKGAAIMATNDLSVRAIAERLKLTRLALDQSQVVFCQLAGITPQGYNNYERARQRPELDKAIALCRAHKLTLDWVYLGDPSGLPYSLASKIAELRKRNRTT